MSTAPAFDYDVWFEGKGSRVVTFNVGKRLLVYEDHLELVDWEYKHTNDIKEFARVFYQDSWDWSKLNDELGSELKVIKTTSISFDKISNLQFNKGFLGLNSSIKVFLKDGTSFTFRTKYSDIGKNIEAFIDKKL